MIQIMKIPMMNKFVFLAVLFFAAFVSPQQRNGLDFFTIEHDNLERSFYLHLPLNFNDDNTYPLVMVLHGGGKGDGDDISKHLGMNKIADKENFIVVYPNGIDAQWNDGRGKTFKRNNSNEDVDDVGFLSSLIDHFIANYKIDPKRVYVTGASNGGMMSFPTWV